MLRGFRLRRCACANLLQKLHQRTISSSSKIKKNNNQATSEQSRPSADQVERAAAAARQQEATWQTLIPEQNWTPRTTQFWILVGLIAGFFLYNENERKKREQFVPFAANDSSADTEISGLSSRPARRTPSVNGTESANKNETQQTPVKLTTAEDLKPANKEVKTNDDVRTQVPLQEQLATLRRQQDALKAELNSGKTMKSIDGLKEEIEMIDTRKKSVKSAIKKQR